MQLLAFGRRQVLDPEVLDLNEVVRRTDGLLQRLIGDNIELVTTLARAAGDRARPIAASSSR